MGEAIFERSGLEILNQLKEKLLFLKQIQKKPLNFIQKKYSNLNVIKKISSMWQGDIF